MTEWVDKEVGVELERGSEGAAGYDIKADLSWMDDSGAGLLLKAGGVQLVPTSLRIAMPPHMFAKVFSRSGLAIRYGIVAEAGVIDSDYRGEVRVLLRNHGPQDYVIRDGDRVAQLVFMPVFHPKFVDAIITEDTVRGAGAFGSTGGF